MPATALTNEPLWAVQVGDCLELMRSMATNSVDLVVTSPPYEDCRSYGIDFNLKGQAYVDWCVERFVECVRVSRGMVCWVIEGKTRNYRWSASPALLMADLHRKGVHLRKPPIYKRDGIPGSGGPDWLKNKYEFIICGSKGGRLAWSDNTACGHPPKFPPGGAPSHHSRDGRVNRPRLAERRPNGDRQIRQYMPPKLANPGNIIDCGPGGGNHLGSELAHESEASFPEQLVRHLILPFCPPGGFVLDPFCGSGTTLAVAVKNGRNAIGFDIRESQRELTMRRMAEIRQEAVA